MAHFYKNQFNLKEEKKQRDFNLLDFTYSKAKESLKLASILTFLLEITIYSMCSFSPLTSKTIHYYHFIFFNLFFIIIIFIFTSTFAFQRRFFIIYCKYCVLCILASSISLIMIHYFNLEVYIQDHSVVIISLSSGLLFICFYNYICQKNQVIEELEKNIIYNKNLNEIKLKYLDNLLNKMFCLYFKWSDDKMLFLNKPCREFIENKFDWKFNRDNTKDFDESILNEFLRSKIIIIN